MADNTKQPHSQGPMLIGVYATLITISALIVFSRLYVRGYMIKAIGIDDYITLIAFVSIILMSHNS